MFKGTINIGKIISYSLKTDKLKMTNVILE